MGIQNFSKFLKTINVSQTSIEHIKQISDDDALNVNIDLPIFMFAGCTAENKKKYDESIYDDEDALEDTIYNDIERETNQNLLRQG